MIKFLSAILLGLLLFAIPAEAQVVATGDFKTKCFKFEALEKLMREDDVVSITEAFAEDIDTFFYILVSDTERVVVYRIVAAGEAKLACNMAAAQIFRIINKEDHGL
jgi:hypothetical protein